ncbi:MAG: hypothetical protein PHD87_08485 [Candidatus Cloacimonetes bacterium]|nr:hypothetical protein [Candidatus Cloacimonadota bacterium]
MNNTKFKPLLLLALLFPLLGAGLGYLLSGTGAQPASQAASYVPETVPGEPVVLLEPEDTLPAREARAPGSLELGIYLALICGAVALLYHYLRSQLAWIAVILLALVFALLYHSRIGLPLTQFFLLALGLGVLLALLVKFIFFHRSLIRWRMIVTSLLGAGLIALFFRGLFWLTRTPFESGFWSGFYVNGLLLFVFISFGLSLADLIIQRDELRRLQAEEPPEDEDA